MILGIDASNIRSGGGVTHLEELLRAADPQPLGFEKVHVWASIATLDRIEDRPWLEKCHERVLEANLFRRALWQRYSLGRSLKKTQCDLLFVPGGSFTTGFRPVVIMSQNMLPFEWREMRRYGFSIVMLKLLLLRYVQMSSFTKASGLIFLTDYASKTVLKKINRASSAITIIPHGINQRFFIQPRPQRRHDEFSDTFPCRILYVSHVEHYKHQWNVVEAVSRLRERGFKVTLDLIGPVGNAIKRLHDSLRDYDPEGAFVTYHEGVPYEQLHTFYSRADIHVFASSCENMPNIVLEGMAAGLPTACSSRGPMPEIMGDAGVFFDPENPAEIADAIRSLLESVSLRAKCAQASFEHAQQFSWRRCADETFEFLANMIE